MALIKCKNCGHSISDKATACPKCGMGLMTTKNESATNVEGVENTISNDIDNIKATQHSSGMGLKIPFFILVLFIGMVGGYFLYPILPFSNGMYGDIYGHSDSITIKDEKNLLQDGIHLLIGHDQDQTFRSDWWVIYSVRNGGIEEAYSTGCRKLKVKILYNRLFYAETICPDDPSKTMQEQNFQFDITDGVGSVPTYYNKDDRSNVSFYEVSIPSDKADEIILGCRNTWNDFINNQVSAPTAEPDYAAVDSLDVDVAADYTKSEDVYEEYVGD